jgi:TolB protein
MTQQDYDLSPDKKASRRYRRLIGLGGAVFLCLCLSGVVATGLATWQNVASRDEGTTIIEAAESLLPDGNPAGTPVNRISFVDEEGQIGTVAPDGSDLRRITAGDDRIFLFPAWSPDAGQLAAVGSERDGGGIFVLADEPAGPENEPRQRYFSEDENPFYLYWSPDSTRITFLANHPDGIGLHLVNAAGEADSRLLDVGQPFYWQWSAAGDRLLYHAGFNREDARLSFLEVGSGDSGENLAQPGFFQAPGISAGGDYLAFAERDAADARWLVVQDSAGEEQQRVPHFGSTALTWSPSAAQVAFISPERPDVFDTGFFGALRLLDVEMGVVRILASDLVLAFFWSPDGRQIAYLTVVEPGEDVTAQKEIFRGRRALQQNNPLRFRLWVADVASGESRQLLTFLPTALYVSQFLPFFDQYALSHQIWSPDSQSLVLPVQESEADVIYVISTGDGSAQAVAEGSIGFWSPR